MRPNRKMKRVTAFIFASCILALFFSIELTPLAASFSSQGHEDPSDKDIAMSLVVLGAPLLDVSEIDPSTIYLSGKERTRVTPVRNDIQHKDVNGDNLPDLVFRLEGVQPGAGTGLELSGSTYNGGSIKSSWYIASADKRTGAMRSIFPGRVLTPQAGCTLGPFTRSIGDEPLAGRLVQNGIVSSCDTTKTGPGTEVADGFGPFFNGTFDIPRFNMSANPICVTVTTTALTCASGVHTTAIVGDHISFFDMCDGYAGDSGVGTGTSGTTSFSFNVPSGQIYTLVFVEQTIQAQCAQFTYTLQISPCTVRCIQDDSSRDNIRFSPTFGIYEFTSCRFAFTLTGRGTITKRGTVVTLSDYSGGIRVLARFDEAVGKGSAFVQYTPFNFSSVITDRNLSDNTCDCSSPQ